MKVAKLAGATATTSFEWLGEVVNLVFYPSRFTPNLVERLMEVAMLGNLDADALALMQAGERRFQEIAGYTPKALRALNEALCTLVQSWDLEGEDGAPYPITPEALAELPFDFLTQVLTTVQQSTGAVPPGK